MAKTVRKRAGKVIHSAITEHATEKARQIRARYDAPMTFEELLKVFNDRKSVRYPVEVRFTDQGIDEGLFAKTEMRSETPADGFVIFIHDYYRDREDVLPALLLYQSVIVNYGDLATSHDAEVFGAGVLGMDREAYYELVCNACDELWSNTWSF